MFPEKMNAPVTNGTCFVCNEQAQVAKLTMLLYNEQTKEAPPLAKWYCLKCANKFALKTMIRMRKMVGLDCSHLYGVDPEKHKTGLPILVNIADASNRLFTDYSIRIPTFFPKNPGYEVKYSDECPCCGRMVFQVARIPDVFFVNGKFDVKKIWACKLCAIKKQRKARFLLPFVKLIWFIEKLV